MTLDQLVGFSAAGLVGIGQIIYIFNIQRSTVKPAILSWLGWSVLMGTTVISQWISEGWEWSHTGILLSACGCSAIAFYSWYVRKFTITNLDWLFLISGIGCILLYLSTSNPWWTTIYAIVADLLMGIPTLIKAYRKPETEKSMAWLLGLIAWSMSLGICVGLSLLYWLFPVYLWLFCAVMVYLTRMRLTRLT